MLGCESASPRRGTRAVSFWAEAVRCCKTLAIAMAHAVHVLARVNQNVVHLLAVSVGGLAFLIVRRGSSLGG